MAWNLKEHQQEPDRLGHLLYWQELVSESVVWQKDHSLLSVVRYRGPDMESASSHEQIALASRLHAIFLTLGAGWTVHDEGRKHASSAYPASAWPNSVAALIDEERRAQVGEPDTHFGTTYYCSLTWHIPKAMGRWWEGLWWKNSPEAQGPHNAVASFHEEITRVKKQLAGCYQEVELLTNDALVGYLKSTISVVNQPFVAVPNPAWNLDLSLPDMQLLPGATPRLGNAWLRLVSIKNDKGQVGYPATTYPGIMDILQDLPLEYRYVVRWMCIERGVASRKLSAMERVYRQNRKTVRSRAERSDMVEQDAERGAQEISSARAMLEEGVVNFGYLTQTIVVWDEDFSRAEDKRLMMEQALRAQGFIPTTEELNSVEAWLGTIPGDSFHNVRQPLLHSLNFVHVMPTTSIWAGPEYVPHLNGPALLVGTGRGSMPFRMNLYDGDTGDFLIVGKKGSGKSAVLAMMCAQWQKYAGGTARVIAFDNGRSLRALTAAVDGTWMDLTPGKTLPLQPLAQIDQEAEIVWASEWISDVLECERIILTPDVKQEVWEGLKSLASFPIHQRSLSGLVGLLQDQTLRQALTPYTVDGPFGSILDGEKDYLHLGTWHAFELEGLLKLPRLIWPVLSVIFHRVENSLDGTPTMIPIDEAHAVFGIPVAAARLKQLIKTLRRKNAIMGFLTQSLSDITESSLADTLMQECVTRLYCPNSEALEPEIAALYEGFGLTARQCELIAYATPKQDYYYQGRAGNRLFSLALGPVAVQFCGRSRIEDLERIETIQEMTIEPFAVAWLRDQQLPDMADLLAECYSTKEKLHEVVSQYCVHTCDSMSTTKRL